MSSSGKYYNKIKTNDMIALFLETYFYNEEDDYKSVLRDVIDTEEDVYVKKVIKSIFEFIGNSMPYKSKEDFIKSHSSVNYKDKKPMEWLESVAVFLLENSI